MPAPRNESPTAASEPNYDKRSVLLVFVGLMVAMLLSSLDQSIFSTALPTIVGELNGVNHMLWVTTAYLVAATIMMPIYGKLGDLIGRKSLFIGALSVFLVGSVVGALAGSMMWLIIGRAIQGLGGGGLMILSQAIIADVVPVRQRSKYMGIMGAVFGVSSVAGPLLGGWFTDSVGWRWAFWFNIPLGVIAIVLAAIFLKIPKHHHQVRLDIAGIATMAVAVTSIILVASWGGTQYEWGSTIINVLIVLAVLFSALFVLAESRAAEPIIPLNLFKSRNFVLVTVAGLLMGVAMFGTISYMPTYFQIVVGANATEAGLLLLSMTFGLMSMAIITGQLAARTGRYRWMPIVSMIVTAIGLVLMSTLTVDTPIAVTLTYLFVLGAGIGTGMQILVLIVQNSFHDSQVGTATAANSFFREIGASLGSSIIGSIFTANLTDLLAERLPAQASGSMDVNSFTPALIKSLPDSLQTIIQGAYNDALTPVFLMLVPMLVLGLVAVWFVKEVPLRSSLEPETDDASAPGIVDAPQLTSPEPARLLVEQGSRGAEPDLVK